ncbi:hypothetical protein L572_0487 [Bordetella bronchiseptica 345]|nr:hypothetical protein L572_0487 [Bordetella bronchiseptica 345]
MKPRRVSGCPAASGRPGVSSVGCLPVPQPEKSLCSIYEHLCAYRIYFGIVLRIQMADKSGQGSVHQVGAPSRDREPVPARAVKRRWRTAACLSPRGQAPGALGRSWRMTECLSPWGQALLPLVSLSMRGQALRRVGGCQPLCRGGRRVSSGK